MAGGDRDVEITAAIHGGRGSIRQEIIRKLVVRFELADGLHIYGEPVPDGMFATQVSVQGPPGFTALEPILPPTDKLRLTGMDVDLEVWSGTVDIAVPFYPKGELASETRPLDAEQAEIEVEVRYQALRRPIQTRICVSLKTHCIPVMETWLPALELHCREIRRDLDAEMPRLFLIPHERAPSAAIPWQRNTKLIESNFARRLTTNSVANFSCHSRMVEAIARSRRLGPLRLRGRPEGTTQQSRGELCDRSSHTQSPHFWSWHS